LAQVFGDGEAVREQVLSTFRGRHQEMQRLEARHWIAIGIIRV